MVTPLHTRKLLPQYKILARVLPHVAAGRQLVLVGVAPHADPLKSRRLLWLSEILSSAGWHMLARAAAHLSSPGMFGSQLSLAARVHSHL
jgi:hypothetical protein